MPDMIHTPRSSHVWQVGHDGNDLHVRYWPSVKHPEGRLVRYLRVDAKTADAVMSAPSIGQALHTLIRGNYEAV